MSYTVAIYSKELADLATFLKTLKDYDRYDLLLEVAVVRPFHSPCSITMTTLDISFAVRRMPLGHWLKGYPSRSKDLLLPLGDNLRVYGFGSLGSVNKLLDPEMIAVC